MTTSPPLLSQISGHHHSTYETLWRLVDADHVGSVGAVHAADFLKRSKLSDNVLGKIWDLSDKGARGFLDKDGFFIALKLIALAQNGKEVSLLNILDNTIPAPSVGDIPTTSLVVDKWETSEADQLRFEQMFNSLDPVNGLLTGDKAKGVMMGYNLPVEVLCKIWDLSDMDLDGNLDKDEFCVAMHLINASLAKEELPQSLPLSLIPLSKQKQRANSLPVGTMSPGSANSPQHGASWIVQTAEKIKYDSMFKTLDRDLDGFVTGTDLRDVFLQSGVQQPVLAHIWNLADISQTGKLNEEQFALAMYFVERKLQGIDPPNGLTSEMIPPSLRPMRDRSVVGDPAIAKELDVTNKELEELASEKLHFEQDIAQLQADIKIRTGEMKSLQSELDTLSATLTQLETQKGEAQKRLDELDTQRSKLENTAVDSKQRCEEETTAIQEYRQQLVLQESTVRSQEDQLTDSRQELSKLRTEEMKLQQEIDAEERMLQRMKGTLQDPQDALTSFQNQLREAEEQYEAMQALMTRLDACLANDIKSLTNVSDKDLSATFVLKPELELQLNSLKTISNGFVLDGASLETADPFSNTPQFGSAVNSTALPDDPFIESDPFKSDPFAGLSSSSDPFGGDPFATANDRSDPFSDVDPFGGAKETNFGAFDNGKASTSPESWGFTVDPFAPAESLVEAAKKRGPPPRPGPPRSKSPGPPPRPELPRSRSPQPPARPKSPKPPRPVPPRAASPAGKKPNAVPVSDPNDPWGSTSPVDSTASDPFSSTDPFASSNSGFANFADFGQSNFVSAFESQTPTPPPVVESPPVVTSKSSRSAFGILRKSNSKSKVPPVPAAPAAKNKKSAFKSKKGMSEEEQLAWATAESRRIEDEKRRQLEIQEQADLELAIALSKAEANP